MTEEERRDDRVKMFLQSLDRLARSTGDNATLAKKLMSVVDKNTEVSALLFDAITKDKDGLIAAIDDLIVEVQGLREDFRIFAQSGGIKIAFGPLFPGRPRR